MPGRIAALSDAAFVRSRGLYLLTGPGGQCDRYRMNGNDVEWIDSTPLIRGAEHWCRRYGRCGFSRWILVITDREPMAAELNTGFMSGNLYCV